MSVLGDYCTQRLHGLLSALEQRLHVGCDAFGRAADEHLAAPLRKGSAQGSGGEGGGVVNEKWVSARREWGACGAHQLKVDDLPLLFDAKPKVEPRLS